jgi:hypothetical protein
MNKEIRSFGHEMPIVEQCRVISNFYEFRIEIEFPLYFYCINTFAVATISSIALSKDRMGWYGAGCSVSAIMIPSSIRIKANLQFDSLDSICFG